ncbi:MAG: hypothetical protein HDT28_01400 [Clostridiales bacterium]|nr:hypothetical protein [Clostridiales bacterium]
MIDTSNWKFFDLMGEFGIFNIESCKCCNAGELLEEGDDIEYIGAKKEDNGVMSRVKYNPELVTKGNCIIFICDGQGSVGYSNYIDHDFIGSTTLAVGYNSNLNEKTGLFIVTILDLERYRYSFGRKYKPNLSRTKIKLPATPDGSPDWKYMEKYIESLEFNPITTTIQKQQNKPLKTTQWKNFYLHRIFDTIMGNGIDAVATTNDNPKYNYIGRSANNNGVAGFIDEIDGETVNTAGALTLSLGGSIGSCFVQDKPFYTAQNVAVLQEKVPLSKHTKLFIATLIRNECKIKYQAFGRELNAHFRKDFTIKLPIKQDANGIIIDGKHEFSDEGFIPDWEWMDLYMKSLPFSDRI